MKNENRQHLHNNKKSHESNMRPIRIPYKIPLQQQHISRKRKHARTIQETSKNSTNLLMNPFENITGNMKTQRDYMSIPRNYETRCLIFIENLLIFSRKNKENKPEQLEVSSKQNWKTF